MTSPDSDRRDELAALRDKTADARDKLASRVEAVMRPGAVGADAVFEQAQEQRTAAARDREAAAADREQAALDRARTATELASAEARLDEIAEHSGRSN